MGRITGSFVAVVAVSVLVLAVMGSAIKGNHDTNARLRKTTRAIDVATARTTRALCALSTDVKRRRDDDRAALKVGRQFLHDHPHGIPGISVKLLRDSVKARATTVRNEQASIAALSIVKCKSDKPPG